ncbi:MAG TPA: hypothetical protein VFL12_00230, partial [Thermoanaerobaculia bacterium]|nr:hypothetical protein [Thermoanaerobaculia bacterium]
MRFGIARRWPMGAACVLLFGPAVVWAGPWRRAEFLDSSVGLAANRPDVRGVRSDAPEDFPVWDGRVVLRAPRLESAEASALASELDARFRAAFDAAEWNSSFTPAEPLHVVAGATPGLANSDVYSLAGGRDAVVTLNVAGRTPADAAAEAVRGAAVLALHLLAP